MGKTLTRVKMASQCSRAAPPLDLSETHAFDESRPRLTCKKGVYKYYYGGTYLYGPPIKKILNLALQKYNRVNDVLASTADQGHRYRLFVNRTRNRLVFSISICVYHSKEKYLYIPTENNNNMSASLSSMVAAFVTLGVVFTIGLLLISFLKIGKEEEEEKTGITLKAEQTQENTKEEKTPEPTAENNNSPFDGSPRYLDGLFDFLTSLSLKR